MSKVVHKRGTWGTETSQYPQEKKVKTIPKVVASEIGRAQTRGSNTTGVRSINKAKKEVNRIDMGRSTKEGESPVYENRKKARQIQSSARHEKSRMKERGPSRKAKY